MREQLLLVALVLAFLGALLLWWSARAREGMGLGSGETIALDNQELVSERLKLIGRPDRIVREDGGLIPEEGKPSAKRVYPGHRLQLGAYLLLMEEEFGERPPYGVVVIRDGERGRVENTEALREEVLAVAEKNSRAFGQNSTTRYA
ncbi:CRISPR-associated exonuclease, Cas4 family [Singulisphaera sp. GP187]|uniref:CRISPR-associated protein Cas4 n=1 Tax=Singulisphaera sp. GP187 TaxID=1882752 RepID=UPI00092AEF5C|nr:Dna2/Cas4 domain-containing protein [Singulisphaera sp. GP187]SIO23546.1 CRISPR-associated exonuclease, Cas4 family [Singulisphaera sp. GP187]